jgi:phenylacetate-CoA ligase
MDIIGRSDDMLIVRGINLYPAAVVAVVGQFLPQTTGKAQVVLRERGPKVEPPLHVRVECNEGVDPSRQELKEAIERRIRADLMVTTHVELMPFGSFERTATKTKLITVEPA